MTRGLEFASVLQQLGKSSLPSVLAKATTVLLKSRSSCTFPLKKPQKRTICLAAFDKATLKTFFPPPCTTSNLKKKKKSGGKSGLFVNDRLNCGFNMKFSTRYLKILESTGLFTHTLTQKHAHEGHTKLRIRRYWSKKRKKRQPRHWKEQPHRLPEHLWLGISFSGDGQRVHTPKRRPKGAAWLFSMPIGWVIGPQALRAWHFHKGTHAEKGEDPPVSFMHVWGILSGCGPC